MGQKAAVLLVLGPGVRMGKGATAVLDVDGSDGPARRGIIEQERHEPSAGS